MFQRRVFEELHDPGAAEVRIPGDVDIIRAGVFERQPGELATSLDRGVVVQFITHEGPPESMDGYCDRVAQIKNSLNKKATSKRIEDLAECKLPQCSDGKRLMLLLCSAMRIDSWEKS